MKSERREAKSQRKEVLAGKIKPLIAFWGSQKVEVGKKLLLMLNRTEQNLQLWHKVNNKSNDASHYQIHQSLLQLVAFVSIQIFRKVFSNGCDLIAQSRIFNVHIYECMSRLLETKLRINMLLRQYLNVSSNGSCKRNMISFI